MNRRDWLRAVGAAATGAWFSTDFGGAPAGMAATQRVAVPVGRTFPVATVNHIALAVADYRKSRDFYVDLFGMRVAWDDLKSCALEFGNLDAPMASTCAH